MDLDLSGAFDLIFSNQILEHLVYPVDMLRGLAKRLVPGGRLVATTPNGRYFKSRLPSYTELGDVSQYEDRQFFPDGDQHFFAYTAEELQTIFSCAGFRSIDVIPYASPWITGHVKFRYLHGRVPPGGLRLMDRMLLGIPCLRSRLAYQLMVIGKAEE